MVRCCCSAERIDGSADIFCLFIASGSDAGVDLEVYYELYATLFLLAVGLSMDAFRSFGL